jgi:sarcosine oxidase
VIGAGINGLAVAHGLRRRHTDARIAILERFDGPASFHASSHGQLRIIRSAYPTVLEAKGMLRALQEWRLFEDELGAPLIHFQRMCFFGPPNGAIEDYADAVTRVAADRPDLAVRQIDVPAARRLYPQFRFQSDSVVLDDRTAGTIFASETIRRLAAHLTEAGVELRYSTCVDGIERVPDGYRVHTDHGDVRSHKLVVASGPWIEQLVSCPPGRATPIRQTVAYLRVEGLPTGTAIGEFPTWAHLGSRVNPLHYGLPAHGGQGLKVARHVTDAPATDLELDDQTADPAVALALVDFVRKHFVVTDVELLETERCMYTCSADENFIVDWLDESRQGMIIGAGSGHMFKWAPLVGRMVTDMLTDGEPGYDEGRALLPSWSLKPG